MSETLKKKRIRRGELRIYRPRQDGKGAASIFDVSIELDPPQKTLKKRRKVLVFWTAAQQLESKDPKYATFAWSNENRLVRFKLEAIDIAQILLVLRGKKATVGDKDGLYHQTPKGNTIFKLGPYDKIPGSFAFEVSNQKKGEKPVRVSHLISAAEALLIESYLTEALKLIHNLAK